MTGRAELPRRRRGVADGLGDGRSILEWGSELAGTLVVAIHDAPDHAGHWALVAEALAVDHRVRAVELPGHGDAWHHRAPRTWEDAIEPVEEVLDDSPASTIVLVGHGYGAALALEVVARRPRRPSGVVVLDVPDATAPPPTALAEPGSFAHRDAYLAHRRDLGTAPRRGLPRGARAALLADLVGSGFGWRRRVSPVTLAAAQALLRGWEAPTLDGMPVVALRTCVDRSVPELQVVDATLRLDHGAPLLDPGVARLVADHVRRVAERTASDQ